MRDRTKKIFANLAAKSGNLNKSSDELSDPFEDSGSEYLPSESGENIIFYLVLKISNIFFF